MKNFINRIIFIAVLIFTQGVLYSQPNPFSKYDINKSQGEAVEEAIKYLDNYYEENYFSKGIEKSRNWLKRKKQKST